ncbi:MAG TPA: hypothetical protein VMW83_02280 [Spirochaetia bacterium]|nr:hypothetical protein [Spirochaetia bacterium]
MALRVLEGTEENLVMAAACILAGGVIVAPSDTNLALTLNPWVDAAIDRAFAIKKRPADSGQAGGTLVDLAAAVRQVGVTVDYVLRGAAAGTSKSSTIVDLTGRPRILRQGDITAARLNAVANVFPAMPVE